MEKKEKNYPPWCFGVSFSTYLSLYFLTRVIVLDMLDGVMDKQKNLQDTEFLKIGG